MPYQIRHREFGVYQGSYLDLPFWYPTSGLPEQEIRAFATEAQARATVLALCTPYTDDPLDPADLTVEPLDAGTVRQLSTVGVEPNSPAW